MHAQMLTHTHRIANARSHTLTLTHAHCLSSLSATSHSILSSTVLHVLSLSPFSLFQNNTPQCHWRYHKPQRNTTESNVITINLNVNPSNTVLVWGSSEFIYFFGVSLSVSYLRWWLDFGGMTSCRKTAAIIHQTAYDTEPL